MSTTQEKKAPDAAAPEEIQSGKDERRTLFIHGNEACAEGALYAGVSFYAGYPITPSSEIAEIMSRRLPQRGDRFIQMEDEIASLCAIIGASLTGSKAMTATSGPGFSLMQEALGYAIMAEIPVVIVDVMRGGPSTGLPTQGSQGDVNQVRWGTHGDHSIIALTASTNQTLFETTVRAFNLAETYRTPVVVLYDEMLGHMRERVVIPEPEELPLVDRLRTNVPEGVDYHPYLTRDDGRLPMSDFGGVHRYNVTGLYHDMWGFPSTNPQTVDDLAHHLHDKIELRADELAFAREFHLEDAEIVVISYGSPARTARQVVHQARINGQRLGLLELQTLWPFPARMVRDACRNARATIVVEMNMGQMYYHIRNAVENPRSVFLSNRIDGRFISPKDIRRVLRIVEGQGE
ncbi:MAG: 2-oxoacid:acceptor oxidoreductase subunit alpha [Spirochaetaceae bacterium]|nr:MAG: 2-oxoacid:acceptor oxidoreductase subunit alpha [Spirochaetaceae bacterium]